MPCDIVVVALGTVANPLLTNTTPALKLNKWKNIVVDEKQATTMEGVFAGGDIVRGGATVILAMGDGKVAAKGIDEYPEGTHPQRLTDPRAGFSPGRSAGVSGCPGCAPPGRCSGSAPGPPAGARPG